MPETKSQVLRFFFEIFLLSLGGLILAFLGTEIWLYSRNTLLENNRWISSKTLMESPPVAAFDFMFSRVPLSRNRLNLGSWNGYNEVTYSQPVKPEEITVVAKWEARAYLAVIFGRGSTGYSGVRLSTDARFPNVFFDAEPEGGFRNKKPLSLPLVGPGRHRITLGFTENLVSLKIDDIPVGVFPFSEKEEKFFGLRGGALPVSVERVTVRDSQGHRRVDEDFANHRGWVLGLCVLFGLWIGGVFAIPLLLKLVGAVVNSVTWRMGALAFCFTLMAIGSLYFAGDYFVWSGRYFALNSRPAALGSRFGFLAFLERSRMRLFRLSPSNFDSTLLFANQPINESLRQAVTKWNLQPRYPDTAVNWELPISSRKAGVLYFRSDPGNLTGPPSVLYLDGTHPAPPSYRSPLRIAYLGSSQTWGVGADVCENSWVAQVHSRLNSLIPNRYSFESVNLAIPGGYSGLLLYWYRFQLVGLKPKFAVIDLSHNDADSGYLKRNLEAIIRLNQENKIPTALILEANSIENPIDSLEEKHRVMRELGQQFNLPVWDLHDFLTKAQLSDSGFFWWDVVHLSSYGQKVAADWLAPKIADLITGQGT